MDHLDKLIPLVVLIGLAAILIRVLRGVARDTPDVAPPEAAMAPVETSPKRSEAVEHVVTEPPPFVEPVTPVERPRRVKRKAVPAIIAPATTMGTVLDLLKDKDALAVALVLREILGPPVSKRTRDIRL